MLLISPKRYMVVGKVLKEVGPSLGVRIDTDRPMKRGGAIIELNDMNLKEIMSPAAFKEVKMISKP